MKTFWCFLLAVLMVLALVACGDGGSESEEASEPQETADEIADTASESTEDPSGTSSESTEDTSGTSSEGTSFSDALDTSSADFDNYYFELETTYQGQETMHAEMWVMGSDVKIAYEGQIMYYYVSESRMAIYSEKANQVVLMPIEGMEEIETPFALADELDRSTFSDVYYAGTEQLDGKTVSVYEYSAGGMQAKYYVWADTGIILKMEADSGDYTTSYYYKNMTLNEVTEADFEYPADASVLDMSSLTNG